MVPFPFGRARSVANSPRTKTARRLWLERLEDRTVPTARALPGTVDFDSLRIDPQSYDAATILVRFRDGQPQHARQVDPRGVTDDKKGGNKGKLNSWSLIFLYERPAGGGGSVAGYGASDAAFAAVWEEASKKRRR